MRESEAEFEYLDLLNHFSLLPVNMYQDSFPYRYFFSLGSYIEHT